MSELLRHVRACNNTVLPGGRVRLLVEGEPAGWLEPRLAERLMELGATAAGDGVGVRSAQLAPMSQALAAEEAFRWRGEAFDVRGERDGRVLGQIDRGALPIFGIQAVGVHLNGLVVQGGETLLWVGRRAANRPLDGGKLDHLVAGGVPAGHTPDATLLKEAKEEAGLPPELAGAARQVGVIEYAMQRLEGLRRDRLYCYDLTVPAAFKPEPCDGEVDSFELWELPRVLDTVRHTDKFKFNVNLVLIDLLLRRGLVEAHEAAELRSALYC